ncbi:hypothetical protein IEQ60_001289 [Salmonella enterica]|nr:hypothetical protein [Salmonella enterica]
MGKLTELEQWEDDVYQIETSDPVLGGPDGVSNRPQKQLANRTQWLKKQIEQANNDLADHIRSRNHPDATLTDKGFVRLYSGVTSLDETMAATPKAVKIAMDNANERLAKARNLSDLQSVPQALQALTIATTKKAVEDTQIGLDRQPVMLISTADDLSNLPAGARRFARNNTGVTVLPTDNNCYIEVLAKRDTNNGTCIQVVEHNNPGNEWTGTRGDAMTETSFTWVRQYNESHRPPQQVLPDMPDALIRGNNLSDLTDPPKAVQNLGLKETLNPTKRVSIGNIGTGAFDGSTPSINIGDSDSGFIGSADGVLDIYCNNAKVGYIDNAGMRMLAGIATNNDLVLQSDERRHIIIQNADGSVRAYIYKDKDDTGIHINNGADGSGDFVLGKDSILYVPFAVRAGGSKKIAIQSDNNSALNATFNLWGNANRPTVIELDDDQGWHLYSQRNPDGSVLFTVNGDIMANRKLNVGAATFSSDGNVNGSLWGGWLNDWINNNLVRAVRLGPVALSGGLWRDYQLGGGQVVTGFHTDGDWEMQGGDDKVYYRPIQYLIGTQWVTAPSV